MSTSSQEGTVQGAELLALQIAIDAALTARLSPDTSVVSDEGENADTPEAEQQVAAEEGEEGDTTSGESEVGNEGGTPDGATESEEGGNDSGGEVPQADEDGQRQIEDEGDEHGAK